MILGTYPFSAFQNSDDDEGTIAKEDDNHEDDELDMLNAEADIPVEELLRLDHPELYAESPDKPEQKKTRRKSRTDEKTDKSSMDETGDRKSKAEENDDQV